MTIKSTFKGNKIINSGEGGIMLENSEIQDRWIRILRNKAEVYEHPIQTKGKIELTDMNYPSIDDICWEIEAFFAGLEKRK